MPRHTSFTDQYTTSTHRLVLQKDGARTQLCFTRKLTGKNPDTSSRITAFPFTPVPFCINKLHRTHRTLACVGDPFSRIPLSLAEQLSLLVAEKRHGIQGNEIPGKKNILSGLQLRWTDVRTVFLFVHCTKICLHLSCSTQSRRRSEN